MPPQILFLGHGDTSIFSLPPRTFPPTIGRRVVLLPLPVLPSP
jgi:hypothetical protein